MPLRDLPPAGNPIILRSEQVPELPWPAGFHALPVNSGTAALALALLAARLRHPEVAAPEVVLPGYGCPDLVAAARFAGVRAVLADIGANDPGYDLASLVSVLNDNTVAVVAVNFLGIAERLRELRDIVDAWPRIALVEDDAQWFPEPLPGADLRGDAVCLSFGRGKPVSLLGGGMLLLREAFLQTDALATLARAIAAPSVDGRLMLKARLYNLLLSPYLYPAINRNPLFKLGRTVFKPLAAARGLDARRQQLLRANIHDYLARPQRAAEQLRAGLSREKNLPLLLASRGARLLRYPVLCRDAAERDALLGRLQRAGLGATALYQRHMPEVEGVGDQVEVRVALDGAREFAGRLLTLPVHAGVMARDVGKMLEIIVKV